jgi:hypothetical protein
MPHRQILLAAAASLLTASAAFAQPDPGAPPAPTPVPFDPAEAAFLRYQAQDLDPGQPLGQIDYGLAGATPAEVYRYLGGLTGAQVVDLLLRCAVVAPYQQMVRAGEVGAPSGGLGAPGNPAAAPAAPAAAAPAAPAAVAAPAAPMFPAEATTFCQNVNQVFYATPVAADADPGDPRNPANAVPTPPAAGAPATPRPATP